VSSRRAFTCFELSCDKCFVRVYVDEAGYAEHVVFALID
jgi:hypothetical protein